MVLYSPFIVTSILPAYDNIILQLLVLLYPSHGTICPIPWYYFVLTYGTILSISHTIANLLHKYTTSQDTFFCIIILIHLLLTVQLNPESMVLCLHPIVFLCPKAHRTLTLQFVARSHLILGFIY